MTEGAKVTLEVFLAGGDEDGEGRRRVGVRGGACNSLVDVFVVGIVVGVKWNVEGEGKNRGWNASTAERGAAS